MNINAEKQMEMVALLVKWVNVNSGSDNLQGLREMLNLLKEDFACLGGEMEEIALPPRKRVNELGEVTETNLGAALKITKHPDAKMKIIFGGHMDIAFPNEKPFPGCDESLIGPGTADMKGGLVILLNALKFLENSEYAGKIGWTIFINPDEEIGSPGSQDFIRNLAKGHRYGMIFEPSLPDGKLVSGRKGSANFTAIARGKSAHAGREFHAGINAVTMVAKFAIEAEKLTHKEKEITLNIGAIEGGSPVNIVPDLAICRFNLRIKTEDDLKWIKEQLNAIANDLSIELFQDSEREPKPFDPETEKLFHKIKECGKELGIPIEWKETGGVCDGNILAAAGIPTVDTLGVVGNYLHTNEEFAKENSLTERTQLVIQFLIKCAKGE